MSPRRGMRWTHRPRWAPPDKAASVRRGFPFGGGGNAIGMRLLGRFGGATAHGSAGLDGVGSLLADAGARGRRRFDLAAAGCLAPLVILPGRVAAAPAARPDRAFVARAVRSGAVWRLLALFVAANGVPLIVSAWFVAYLTRDAGITTGVAGALAFAVFGLTTV